MQLMECRTLAFWRVPIPFKVSFFTVLFSLNAQSFEINVDLSSIVDCSEDPVFKVSGHCDGGTITTDGTALKIYNEGSANRNVLRYNRPIRIVTSGPPPAPNPNPPGQENIRDSEDILEDSTTGPGENEADKPIDSSRKEIGSIPTIASQDQSGFSSNGYQSSSLGNFGNSNVEVRNGFVYEKRPTTNQPGGNNRSISPQNDRSFGQGSNGLNALESNRRNFGGGSIDEESSDSGQATSSLGARGIGAVPQRAGLLSDNSSQHSSEKKKHSPKSALDKIARALGLNRFFGTIGAGGLFSSAKKRGDRGLKRGSLTGKTRAGRVLEMPPDLAAIYNKYSKTGRGPANFDSSRSILLDVCKLHQAYGRNEGLQYNTLPCTEN